MHQSSAVRWAGGHWEHCYCYCITSCSQTRQEEAAWKTGFRFTYRNKAEGRFAWKFWMDEQFNVRSPQTFIAIYLITVLQRSADLSDVVSSDWFTQMTPTFLLNVVVFWLKSSSSLLLKDINNPFKLGCFPEFPLQLKKGGCGVICGRQRASKAFIASIWLNAVSESLSSLKLRTKMM